MVEHYLAGDGPWTNSKPDAFRVSARLRRDFPRNADILLLCEWVEKLSTQNSATNQRRPKRDRAGYMRDYRKRKSNG